MTAPPATARTSGEQTQVQRLHALRARAWQSGSRGKWSFAERMGWPAGAVSDCLRLEWRYPGWSVSWWAENICVGFRRPAGFLAMRRGRLRQKARGCGYASPMVYGATPDELAEAIEVMDERIAAEDEERARWSGFMIPTWWVPR